MNQVTTTKSKKQHGGKRKGAGKPKGKLLPRTLERKAVLTEFRQRTMNSADRLWNAQFSKAVGSIMVYRVDEYEDEKGKKKREHILLTDADEIKCVLDETDATGGDVGDNFYIVTTVAPDNKAIDSMLDRTFGKSHQTLAIEEKPPEFTDADFAVELFHRLINNRGWSESKAIEGVKAEFPDIDTKLLTNG